uniref:ATP synthase F0 subunit 8 n=1 Tax=Cypridopsis vidua TaxID=230730 RepID=A0A0N7ATF4_9CRUS|nr:ATP synthase F0 subunit 8 [Cypridopsis vidua]AJY78603.1 ATP synthase F0 subunit 8 [Cypridopsis vidua]
MFPLLWLYLFIMILLALFIMMAYMHFIKSHLNTNIYLLKTKNFSSWKW